MARRKVKLAYIENKTARKTCFNNRKEGLLNKVDQLSKLCGVDACAVIYNPEQDVEPEVYPNSYEGMDRVLSQFEGMNNNKKNIKMMNQHEFLRQSIIKANEQLERLRRENHEKEMTQLMLEALVSTNPNTLLENLNLRSLRDLNSTIDRNLGNIDVALQHLKNP